MSDAQSAADEARLVLERADCVDIAINGEGENWFVSAGLASDDGVVHSAVAYSGKSPHTPNDPLYLAGSLLDTLRKNAAAHMRGMGMMGLWPPRENNSLELGADLLAAEGEAVQDSGDELVRSESTDEHANPEGVASDEHERTRFDGAVVFDAPPEPGNTDASEGDSAADFLVGDPEPDVVDADFIAIEGQPDDIAVEEPQPTDPGGVAYFGDNIHTIKLAKMGRLSQIARAAKEALQAGWTLAEFASLQNLIVRIDRGEAPDDPEARARFMAISERSAAMARVDAYREQREGELEEADRPGIEAFDPESGWP